MAEAVPSQRRGAAWWIIVAVLATLVVLLPPVAPPAAWHALFAAAFLGIVITALPFLLLGSVLGGLVEALLPARVLPALARRLGPAGLPAAACAGIVLPVCECGVVGVTRGLIGRGLPVPHAVAYLLAGPVLNPIVLATTWLAFNDWSLVAARAGGALAIALGLAAIATRFPAARILRHAPPAPHLGGAIAGAARRPLPAGMAPAPRTAPTAPVLVLARPAQPARWSAAASHALGHFLDMAGYFTLGSLLAALLLVGLRVSGHDLASLAADGGLVASSLGMMVVAFVLSLCAEADAFVAASSAFATVGKPALLAFLVFGPLFDIKLLLMHRTLFRDWFIALIAAGITIGTLGWVLLVGWAL
jgi:uncharacterized membrane protein YraQ (UPF0718 family)